MKSWKIVFVFFGTVFLCTGLCQAQTCNQETVEQVARRHGIQNFQSTVIPAGGEGVIHLKLPRQRNVYVKSEVSRTEFLDLKNKVQNLQAANKSIASWQNALAKWLDGRIGQMATRQQLRSEIGKIPAGIPTVWLIIFALMGLVVIILLAIIALRARRPTQTTRTED